MRRKRDWTRPCGNAAGWKFRAGALVLILALVGGCAPAPVMGTANAPQVPTVALETATSGEVTTAVVLTELPTVTATTIPTSNPETPVVFHACEPAVQVIEGHFPLGLPIGPGDNQRIDRTYRYGSTANGQYDPHHGVEFQNPRGTAVLASAEGVVVAAGTDTEVMYGPYLDFYGNLVILEHELPGIDEPVYTLYGHLSTVEVEVGQRVARGVQIGRVGYTGWAIGSHLHFEVRVGANEYGATRNPELWLAQPGGALAGYILNGAGDMLVVEAVLVRHMPGLGETPQRSNYLEPYQGDDVNGDPAWGEGFAVGGLAPGIYQVAFTYGGLYRMEVEVQEGMLTLVAFCITE